MPGADGLRIWEDDLVDRLAAAYGPTEFHPPESTVTALRMAVASMPIPVTAPMPIPPEQRAFGAARMRRRWAAASAFAAASLLGPGIAFAAGAPVPPAVRELATGIGLPVTPQPVVNTQNASAALRALLDGTSPSPIRVAAAGRDLSAAYLQLDPSERAQVSGSPPHLLEEACRYLSSATDGSAVGAHAWSGCEPRDNVSTGQGIGTNSTGARSAPEAGVRSGGGANGAPSGAGDAGGTRTPVEGSMSGHPVAGTSSGSGTGTGTGTGTESGANQTRGYGIGPGGPTTEQGASPPTETSRGGGNGSGVDAGPRGATQPTDPAQPAVTGSQWPGRSNR